MPKVAESLLLPAFCCFPPASPAFAPGSGKQKRPRMAALNRSISPWKSGAGEGIRTLDPNLGRLELGTETAIPADGFQHTVNLV